MLKSVPAEPVEISSRQTGIMYSPPKKSLSKIIVGKYLCWKIFMLENYIYNFRLKFTKISLRYMPALKSPKNKNPRKLMNASQYFYLKPPYLELS